jgi:hypothetical protein
MDVKQDVTCFMANELCQMSVTRDPSNSKTDISQFDYLNNVRAGDILCPVAGKPDGF